VRKPNSERVQGVFSILPPTPRLSPYTRPADNGAMFQRIRHIVALVVLGLAILVAVQNVETVDVDFLFWTFSAPRVLLLFAVFAAGVIVGWLTQVRAERRHG